MASRSQMRLQQLTGSAVDIKSEVAQYIAPSQAAALTGSDLQDVLGAMAAAIQRIHGKASNEVFYQDEGVFDTSKFDINTAGAFTADAAAASYIKTSAGDLSIDGSTGVDLDVAGNLVLDIAASSITAHQNFMPNSDDSQDIGGPSTDRFANAYVVTGTFHKINADLADFASAAVADITPTHVVFAGTGGELEGNSGLIWDGSDLKAASAEIADLTSGRVVLAGAAGALEDNTNFTYNGTTLFVASGAPGISDSLDLAGDMQVAGTGSILGDLTVAGSLLVQGSTTTLDTQNLLVEDPLIVLAKNQTAAASLDQGMIFQRSGDNYGMIWDESADEFAFINAQSEDGTTSGNVTFTEYADLQARTGSFHGLEVVTMAVSDLTDNRVVIAGPAGELEDDANFTFNGSGLRLGGTVTLDVVGGLASLDGGIDVSSLFSVDGVTGHALAPQYNVGASSANNIALDSSNLKLTADAKAVIDAGDDIVLDHAASSEISIADAGIAYGSISLSAGAANDMVIKASQEQLELASNSGYGIVINPADGAINIQNAGNDAGTIAHDSANSDFMISTAGVTNSLFLDSSEALKFDDEGRSGSSWAGDYISLSDDTSNVTAAASWDAYIAAVGEVSLLDGIAQAAQGSVNAGKWYVKVTSSGTTVDAATDMTKQLASQKVANVALNALASVEKSADVYVNGQLMIQGSGSDFDYDYDSSTSLFTFTFNLEADDIVQLVIR